MRRMILISMLLMAGGGTAGAATLQPFVAEYQAYNAGKLAGTATLRVERAGSPHWRIDLDIQGKRGLAGLAGLDIEQSTVFDEIGGSLRPVSQATVRKAFLLRRKSVGTYDWAAGTASWTGDVKPERRAPIALRPGDMSGLLINLAIVRDAAPGTALRYRFVDGGRIRSHEYTVSSDTENIAVDDLAYEALRVSRSNGGNDETIVWVAEGVPAPVRILQRTDGEDGVDLRLTGYRGVQ